MKRSETVILCGKAIHNSDNLCKHKGVNQEKGLARQQEKGKNKEKEEKEVPVKQHIFTDG